MEDIWRYKKYEPFFGSWYFEKDQREIGSGSFGSVFRIVRHDTNVRPSALKIITIPSKKAELETLRFQGMDEDDMWQYYRQMADDIKKEYELMSELKGCDNIVSCEDFKIFKRDDRLGFDIMIRMELLMPLINYRTETKREIGEGEIVKLGIDICQALEKCQVNNIIHRDIKPENIFISQYGNFKLGDFGIARTIEKTDMLMSRKGTKNYMAPEVYNSLPYDRTADIYSLGIVLYQMLNDNCPPFLTPETARSAEAREQAFIQRIKGKELERPVHGSEQLVNIILKACQFGKDGRYNNPQDLRMELEKLPISEVDMSDIDIFDSKVESDIYTTDLLQNSGEASTALLNSEAKEEYTSLLHRSEDDATSLLNSDKTELLRTDNKKNLPILNKIWQNKKYKIAFVSSIIVLFIVAGAGIILKGRQTEESRQVSGVESLLETSKPIDNMATATADNNTTATPSADVLSEEERILAERRAVTKLNGKDLDNISDLSEYENVETLDLSDMTIDNISAVSDLTKLKELNLSYTNVEDISVLTDCENLVSLDISYNNENMTKKKIMTTLSSMTQLKELDLTGDMVVGDYEDELSGLTSLEVLRAGSTGISDGSFLSGLKKLKTLALDANLMFEDFKKIKKLTNIENLNIAATGIVEIDGIENMKKLEVLDISLTDISDISMLKSLENLKKVTVSESDEIKKQVTILKKKLKKCKFELV